MSTQGFLGGGIASTASNQRIEKYVPQSNTFVQDDCVRQKSDGSWELAIANSIATAEVDGVVESATADGFVVVREGWYESALTIEGNYFLSASSAGKLTTTAPASPNVRVAVVRIGKANEGVVGIKLGIAPGTSVTTLAATSLYVSGVSGEQTDTVQATTTVTTAMSTLVCDASSNAFTLHLPTCVGNHGKCWRFRKTDATKNEVVIQPNGSEKVNGADKFVLLGAGDYVEIFADTNPTPNSYWTRGPFQIGDEVLLGVLTNANMNTTNDQFILVRGSTSRKYALTKIFVTDASISLTTAVGGIYTGTSKSGVAVVAASQVYSALTSSSKLLDLTLAAGIAGTVFTSENLYLSLTTAQGAAATANFYVYGRLLAW